MKTLMFVTLAIGITVAWLVNRSRAQVSIASKPEATKAPEPKEAYLGLRRMMLDGTRAKFGLPPTPKPSDPWGVLMDWGINNGTATVVAMSDGSASVYLSSGGGYIGGKGQEPIRLATEKAVEVARTV
jgi:hypothetical protein